MRRGTVMITGVGSVAILVHDAKKSAEWYHDKLGFEIVGLEGNPEDVERTYLELRKNGVEFSGTHHHGMGQVRHIERS